MFLYYHEPIYLHLGTITLSISRNKFLLSLGSCVGCCRFQLRCVLERPLWAIAGCQVKGTMRLVAHARQSYDIHVSLEIPPVSAIMEPQKVNHLDDHHLVRSKPVDLYNKIESCCKQVHQKIVKPGNDGIELSE